MVPTKTPTSSVPVGQLLIRRVWYRSLAWIWKVFSGRTFQRDPTTCPSAASRLPQEVVEIVIANLMYDLLSLRACCLTCYSLYIAAVPHLHHNLIVRADFKYRKFRWPETIFRKHRLGLLPMTRRLHITRLLGFYGPTSGVSPRMFSHFTLRTFTGFTNLRELGIERLIISKFMPTPQRYFGHFSLTIRSLSLGSPYGSHRQITYFIGLFRHLEDLKLIFSNAKFTGPTDVPAPPPPFIPPLRGRLTVMGANKEFLKIMINVFGGVRFRFMEFFNVDGMRLLLGASADTLEAVRFYQTDPRAKSSLRDFDLSRNRSLRAVEVPTLSLVHGDRGFLRHVLSTITSSVFCEVVAIYRDHDLYDVVWLIYRSLAVGVLRKIDRERREMVFEVFREAQQVRDFQLVFRADVWGDMTSLAVRELQKVVAAEKANKGFNDFSSEPLVICNPQDIYPPVTDSHRGRPDFSL